MKPNSQIAHLVFANTRASSEKTKRAIFCHRYPMINQFIKVNLKKNAKIE
jgi:hypothetical protein